MQGMVCTAWGPHDCSSMFAAKKGSSSFISLLRDLRIEHSLGTTTTTVTLYLCFKMIDFPISTSLKHNSYALNM